VLRSDGSKSAGPRLRTSAESLRSFIAHGTSWASLGLRRVWMCWRMEDSGLRIYVIIGPIDVG
jgi:hypothetical protein